MPQINIPIYEFKSRDLSIPIELSYHPANIKPADHSSWVGLGWNLKAGGVITRIQNDLPDEFINYKAAQPGTGDLSNVKNGFFFNYQLLGANWLDTTFIDESFCRYQAATVITLGECFPDYRKDKAPDEFVFSFLGMSGSLFMGQDGQWKLKSKQDIDFSVKIEMGKYKVVQKLPNSSAAQIRNCITRIILTGADGTSYYFGGDSAVQRPSNPLSLYFPREDSTSIEFSRVGAGGGDFSSRDGGTIPVSWYLTKVKSTTGDSLVLKYSRDGYQIMNYPNGVAYTYYCPTCTPGASYTGGTGTAVSDQLSILDGVTLSSITGANGSVQFEKSRADVKDFTILNPNPLTFPDATFRLFEAYGADLFNGTISSVFNILALRSTFMKLNRIVINTKDSVLRTFSFTYDENATNRLFLKAVIESDTIDRNSVSPYTFTYFKPNNLANVPYETNKIDHWGYYNGTNPLTGLYFPYNGYPYLYDSAAPIFVQTINQYYPDAFDDSFNITYTANRSPNSDSMQYGVLTKITYPTGGNTQFDWETNLYSKCIDQTPVNNQFNIAITNLNQSVEGSGFRIRQIRSQSDSFSAIQTKSYLYYRDYTNNNYTSSGVLNSAQPKYIDDYGSTNNFTYRVWSTNNRVPLHYTNGAPITYTSVQEINNDGSYKNFTYTNHDNGHLNKIPARAFVLNYGSASYQDFTSSSLELERGLLIDESSYKQNSVILNTKNYQYNDDLNRFNNYVKKYLLENKFSLSGTILNFQAPKDTDPRKPGPPIYTGFNFFALKEYTYFPFLKTLTETQYNENGTNPLITSINYTYDRYRNKKTSTLISSKGEQVTTTFKYAADTNISNVPPLPFNEQPDMLTAHMVNQLLERVTIRNSVEVEHARFDYQKFENENTFIIPVKSWLSSRNNTLEYTADYLNYDSKGNILKYRARSGILTSLQWGYNQVYPTAKVINADNNLRVIDVTSPGNLTGTFLWSPGDFSTKTTIITKSTSGNLTINFGFSSFPDNISALLNYTLVSTANNINQGGILCIKGPNATSNCGIYPSSFIFTNLPAGTYSLSVTPSSDYSIGFSSQYSYQDIIHTPTRFGATEFYYNGFEEDSINTSMTFPCAGIRYHLNTFTVPYNMPSSKSYVVDYFYLQNGRWHYIKKAFQNNMVLSEGIGIDEVRVYPNNAQITTYTYRPLVGMLSQEDMNGKLNLYDYDRLGRLKSIKDQDNKVIKVFDYKYKVNPQQ